MSHARLSPSNHRWPHCPGSVREEANYPDSCGDAAIDGTGTHLLLELCVDLPRCNHLKGQIIGVEHPDKPEGWMVDDERIARVNDALAYLERRKKELGGVQLYSESKSNPGEIFGRDDWHGTCDVTLIGIGQKVLEVIDYKDGRGYVSEKDNTQLLSYAGGKLKPYVMEKGHTIPNLDECEIETVRMTIVQPRLSPSIRYVDMSVREVWERLKELAVAAKATDDPQAPLIPGEWCLWCKHGRAGNCVEKNKVAGEGLTIMTDMVPTNNNQSIIEAVKTGQLSLASMTGDQIAAFMDAAGPIRKLLEQVETEAMVRLQASPQSVPGYKIGNGRKSKKWADEEEVVAKKLKGMRFKKDEIYPVSLVPPAKALQHEGLSDRQVKNLQEMIEEVPGREKVVKDDSPQVLPPARDMFKEIPTEKTISFMDNIPNFM